MPANISIDRSIETIYRLTPMQQGMLFHAVLEPDSGVFVQCTVCTLPGSLDPKALRQAWQVLIVRHAVLRTSFLWGDIARPLQVVNKAVELEWTLHDWSAAEAPGGLDRLMNNEVARGFALDHAPLLRVSLVRMPDTSWRQVWTYHHILLDGWSLPVLFDELSQLYSGFVQGKAPTLEPPTPYRSFIAWLGKQDPAAATTFWQQELHGLTMPSQLGLDGPLANGVQGERMTTHLCTLSDALVSDLRHFARTHRLTLSTMMQGAWAMLLARHTGESDVLFGATVSGRPASLAGVERIVGPFINSVPVRVRVDGEAVLLTWLADLQRRSTAREEFAFCALTDIQRASAIPAGVPMFDNLLVVENYPAGHLLGGADDALRMQDFVTRERTNVKLTISVVAEDGVQIGFSHDPAQLGEFALRRLSDQFHAILEAMVKSAGARVDELDLTGPAETARLHGFNATHAPFPQDACLHHLVEAQVARTPDATAIVFGTQSLSYANLNSRANRLAHHLVGLGVLPDTLVAVCAERSLEMVVALLAVLKAGGAYIPVDPSYPPERIAYMLQDAGAPVVLVHAHLREILPSGTATVVCLDDVSASWHDGPDSDPATRIAATDLAYVIYTSGSTGRPKGAQNTHRAIVNRMVWMQGHYGLTPEDRVLQKTPFSFDVSVWEFFWPLTTGARLVVAKPDGHRDNAYMAALIHREKITTLHFVPSMLRAMLEEPSVRLCLRLRRVICSGEVLPADLAHRFFELLAPVELYNLYGPTECAVDVTAGQVQPGDTAATVPIGRPIANTRIYVLDAHRRRVPVGVAGELYIGGVQVGRGYLNRPDLTGDSFLADPFALLPDGPTAGAMMYRTGDTGRWREDGAIEYIGRRDFQAKVRGFRIEPGEIEARIRQQEAIHDTVVLVREDRAGDRRVVAYVVPESGRQVEIESLRTALRGALPEYMLPTAYVTLAALPLGASGKVDRQALPAPEYRALKTAVAPSTPTEKALAEIIAGVLGLDAIGCTDDFFEFGGDSILLLQVIARARKADLKLTARQIYDHPNVAALAAIAGDADTVTLPRIAEPVGGVPLSPIQQWFFAQQPRNPHHFNQAMLVAVPPQLTVAVLQQALHHLASHHDALRLRLSEEADGSRQMWPGATPLAPVIRVDLPADPGAAEAATAMAAERAQTSLHVAAGPLLRAVLFHDVAGRATRLLLVIHHLVVDGVSWRILLEDLAALIAQISAGAPVALPPSTSSFRAWSARLQEHAGSEGLLSEMAYWKAVELSASGAVPVDHDARGDGISSSTDTVQLAFDEATTRALLQTVPAAYASRINEVLLAALARALTAWTGHSNVLIDLEGHGREELFDGFDLSRSVGWFTSLFPLALASAGTPDGDVAVMKERLRAVPASGVGYGILRYLRPGAPAMTSDADICFNYLGQFDGSSSTGLPDTPFTTLAGPTGSASDQGNRRAHPIDIIGQIHGGRLFFDWVFSPALHERSTIEQVAGTFRRALQALVNHAVTAHVVQVEEFDPVVVIQSGRRRVPPVFCVPGIGGSVIYFSPLAQRLGEHTPVLGMQPRGFDADMQPHTRIEDMADAYVDAIRAMPFTQPVRLLGHSLGAMVVFEMAQRLVRLGYELAPVILLDPPTLLEMAADRQKPGQDMMLSMITEFLANRYGSIFDVGEQAWSVMNEDQRIEYLRQTMISHKLISARTPFQVIRSKVRMVIAHGNLDYWPSGTYDGDVAILRPTRDYVTDGAADRDPATGWVCFAPRLVVLESEGDHMTMLDHVTVNALVRNIESVWGSLVTSDRHPK